MANTANLPVRRSSGAPRGLGPLLAGALVLLLPAGMASARAQDAAGAEGAPLVSLDRLRFEFKCYFSIPEWKGRGEETFLKKLAAQKAAYKAKQPGELAAVEALMAEGYWRQKATCEELGDADGADAMAGMILGLESVSDKVVSGYRDRADAFVVQRNLEKAKKLEASNRPAEARQAYATIVGAKDPKVGQQAVSALVRIVRMQKDYQAVLESNDLADIGAMLDGVLAELKKDLGGNYDAFLKGTGGREVNADLKGVEDERTRNAGSIQSLQVVWRDVTGALGGVQGTIADTSEATFRLEPESPAEGKVFPATGTSAKFKRTPFPWHRGVYTVQAFAPGADRPFAVLRGVVAKDSPGVIEVPNRVPAGMVWVPPLKPGGEALFADRFEVTVAQVEAVAGSDEKLAGVVKDSQGEQASGDTPAWFAEEGAAQAYAKAVGRSIPTAEQWLLAAFGGASAGDRPYPWGKEPPDGSRAFLSVAARPEPVGKRPAGASPCGAEDMAGNLAEWVVKDGQLWFLGGYYGLPEGLAPVDGKSLLRDPMPGPLAYDAWAGTDRQNQYLKYRYKADNGYWAGLRTVVGVPAAK